MKKVKYTCTCMYIDYHQFVQLHCVCVVHHKIVTNERYMEKKRERVGL